MNHIKTTAIVAALALFLANCSTTSKFYTPAELNTSATVSLSDLNQGKELLLGKCGECHRTPAPRKHDAAGWTETLKAMQPKAKISDAETNLIFKYLTSEKNT
jgi:mono/diheme cytochrome c family protein